MVGGGEYAVIVEAKEVLEPLVIHAASKEVHGPGGVVLARILKTWSMVE